MPGVRLDGVQESLGVQDRGGGSQLHPAVLPVGRVGPDHADQPVVEEHRRAREAGPGRAALPARDGCAVGAVQRHSAAQHPGARFERADQLLAVQFAVLVALDVGVADRERPLPGDQILDSAAEQVGEFLPDRGQPSVGYQQRRVAALVVPGPEDLAADPAPGAGHRHLWQFGTEQVGGGQHQRVREQVAAALARAEHRGDPGPLRMRHLNRPRRSGRYRRPGCCRSRPGSRSPRPWG